MIVNTAIVVNSIVISVIVLLIVLAIIHLVRVYRKSPCGDCSESKNCKTKHCEAFTKEKLLKEYKKAVKREEKENKKINKN